MKGKRIVCRCLCVILIMLSASSIAEDAVPATRSTQLINTSKSAQGPTVMHNPTLYFAPSSPGSQTQESTTWLVIPAQLNQRMATRSGPSSLYTEELGTLPMSTAISVLWQEKTGVAWAMVEYKHNGKLYRAYTGMKRIDAEEEVPVLRDQLSRASLLLDVRPYYGPGTQYKSLDYILRTGLSVLIYAQDQGYALIEYAHPETEQPARAWVPLSALRFFY